MLFQVENRREARSTHCGVLEFIAEEGMMYMPYWVSSSPCRCSSERVVSCSRASIRRRRSRAAPA
jgi:hypothetical protein